MNGLDDFVVNLASQGQLVHLKRLASRPARTASLARPLPQALEGLVPVDGLWSHQAIAIDLARGGLSVAVATGTSSGKSLCYQLPIAEAVGAGEGGTALLLYPTKALAQDQLRSFRALGLPSLVAVTYDGDTPPAARAWAQRHANVVLTNPDMLHVGILPFHARWAKFLARLRYVVVDELHTLRGIFGTHVAHLLRRLRRLAKQYRASPTFLFGSATIGSPAELASALCGLPVHELTDDGSPRGERLFALWNPPLLDQRSGARASANLETAELLVALVTAGYRAIAFVRSRKGAELVATYTKRRLPPPLANTVRPYRAGYLAGERRDIEAELFSGQLSAVVATSALELGIDVGTLDACLLDGFPGTIASMWQQAGRAGRAGQRSLAVLVASPDQLHQWWMAHPTELFTRSAEPAVINPSNPFVLLPHLACAAFEWPLSHEDETYWAPPHLPADALDEAVRRLALDDRLVVRAGKAVYTGRRSPAASLGLRTGSADEYRIVDNYQRVIGTIDAARAFEVVHPGAIYLHQGQQYQVQHLDLEDRAAWVEPTDADEYTQARSSIDFSILGVDQETSAGRASLYLGPLEVSEQIVGYQRKHLFSGEVLEQVSLCLPPSRLSTRAFWYTLSDEVVFDTGVPAEAIPGALHAAEHAGIGILPLFTICDRWDVSGVSTPYHPNTGSPTIVIYDGYPGGAGIAELGFSAAHSHLQATLEVVAACPCSTGCPSCVQSPKCGNWNDPLNKAAAVALLRTTLA